MTGTLTNKSSLSIIIPVLNEIDLIADFITHLNDVLQDPQEIIFVDGGSTDGTWEWLQKNCSESAFQSEAGRAHQMNYGASKASFPFLYFVHVDSKLPQNFDQIISTQMKKGNTAGCFRLQFDPSNWVLKRAAAGSKWNHLLCRGGDQTLFVSKQLFTQLKGFDIHYRVCEDLQFIKKLYQNSSFTVLPHAVTTSSRRFYENGTFRLLFHFGIIHFLHWLGASPRFLHQYYQHNIC